MISLPIIQRYTNPFAYSNNLAYRLDYYKATEAARISAGKTGPPQRIPSGHDEMRPWLSFAPGIHPCFCSAVAPRAPFIPVFPLLAITMTTGPGSEGILVYVPDSAKMPVPTALRRSCLPGSTQAASTFMDCSGWWPWQGDEGCVVIIVGQFCCRTSAASLTYGDEGDSADLPVQASFCLIGDQPAGRCYTGLHPCLWQRPLTRQQYHSDALQ